MRNRRENSERNEYDRMVTVELLQYSSISVFNSTSLVIDFQQALAPHFVRQHHRPSPHPAPALPHQWTYQS